MTISGDNLVRCIACSLIQPDECKAALSGRFSRLEAIRRACSDEGSGLNLQKLNRLSQLVEGKLDSKENKAFLDALNSWSTLSFWQWVSMCGTSMVSLFRSEENHYKVVAQKISGYMNEFFRDSIERFSKNPKTLYSADIHTICREATTLRNSTLLDVLSSHFKMKTPDLFYQACFECHQDPVSLQDFIQNAPAEFLHFTLICAIEYDTEIGIYGGFESEKDPLFTENLVKAVECRFSQQEMSEDIRKTLLGIHWLLSKEPSPVFNSPRYAKTWAKILATLQRILERSEMPRE